MNTIKDWKDFIENWDEFMERIILGDHFDQDWSIPCKTHAETLDRNWSIFLVEARRKAKNMTDADIQKYYEECAENERYKQAFED